MITRHKISVHIAERWEDDNPICDICRKEIIEADYYDKSEINIEGKIGSYYPDSGDCRTGYRLDVCPECFENKVKPLIEKTFRVKFTEYDVETYNGYYDETDKDLF
jgi:hypothetical protein